MRDRYLEVTFRKGKPLAAYLHLPRKSGVKSARTEKFRDGLLVDYDQEGDAIGIEITAPSLITVDHINLVLEKLGKARIGPGEFPPLAAA
jgi:uncharacterized protein YuzE